MIDFRAMPKIEFEYFGRLLLVLAVLVALAAWQFWGEPGKRRRAQRAIDAVVAACDQGGGEQFDRRMAEASAALEDLDRADREMYQITLDNQLIAHRCK